MKFVFLVSMVKREGIGACIKFLFVFSVFEDVMLVCFINQPSKCFN